MVNSEVISGSNADGFEPEPASRSSSGDSSADRSPSDLHLLNELIEEFENVGFGEVAKEQSVTMISVSEGNRGVESKAVDRNQEEEGDGDGGSESESEKREAEYPLRPWAEDCAFYMKTGSCKYGSICKFNHPLPNPRKTQYICFASDETKPNQSMFFVSFTYALKIVEVREKEDHADKLVDCKYFFRTGGCKYGETCKFNHTKSKSCLPSEPELNFLGLPIRPGEIECPYYMRTGSCKYGAECKFNHPDLTTLGGTESPSFNGGSIGSFSPKTTLQASSTSWSSPRNGTAPFIPSMLSQSRGVPSQTPEWNGYQASVYSSERGVFSPSTTHHTNNSSSAETSVFSQYKYQTPAEEFPERPDQPECSYYLKTGDCKFRFNCRYHHPKNRLPKQAPYALNDKGLPLRPDQNICTHYSRYGICKFGPACRFDHSIQLPYSMEAPLSQ
ncbi:unnamed protein product [Thlaspi arvense]|uniref:C3H1-type domain-containing protein n=1 Tax=Thlaspi arvense TaxID=13288 RepID=A0AAU9SF50_THLAR|nr:unnamed protein product [Thlaspi arvense]